jgi:hypothetical protein
VNIFCIAHHRGREIDVSRCFSPARLCMLFPESNRRFSGGRPETTEAGSGKGYKEWQCDSETVFFWQRHC